MQRTWIGRQSERRTCSIRALVRPYDGDADIDCIITDFSAAGARLEFAAGCDVPSAFDLHVPSRGDVRHALLRWKTPEAVGVEFILQRGTTDDQRYSELLVRVSQVEDGLRALRAGSVLAQATGSVPAAPSELAGVSRLDQIEERLADLESRERSGEDATLALRVTALEARSADILLALKQTLAMLGALKARDGMPGGSPLAEAS